METLANSICVSVEGSCEGKVFDLNEHENGFWWFPCILYRCLRPSRLAMLSVSKSRNTLKKVLKSLTMYDILQYRTLKILKELRNYNHINNRQNTLEMLHHHLHIWCSIYKFSSLILNNFYSNTIDEVVICPFHRTSAFWATLFSTPI